MVFDRIDTSGDGTISADEMAAKMATLPEQHRAKLAGVLQEIDADGSGDIEFQEFDAVFGKWIRNKLAEGLDAALSRNVEVVQDTKRWDDAVAHRTRSIMRWVWDGWDTYRYAYARTKANIIDELTGEAIQELRAKNAQLQERAETAEASLATAKQHSEELTGELRAQNAQLQERAEMAEASLASANQQSEELTGEAIQELRVQIAQLQERVETAEASLATANQQTMARVDLHAATRFRTRMFRLFRMGVWELQRESYEENILWAPEWERTYSAIHQCA